MKKTLFLLALACCLPTAGHSQGFMKKLKQKVENAVGISESTDIAEDQTQADELAKRARREAAVTWRKYLAQIPGRADRTEQGALPAEYVPAGRHGESRNDPRLCRETRQPQYRDHLRQPA